MSKQNWPDWILWEDQDFLALDKPPFISCLDERGAIPKPSILQLLRKSHSEWKLAHRLDKETSGVLLVAKNQDAYKEITRQFEEQKIWKLYLAVCEGRVPVEEFFIEKPLSKGNKGRGMVDPRGKWAGTWVKGLAPFKHFTLVQAMPVTGRFHQIRIHVSSEGFPIAGDMAYGGALPLLSGIKRGFRPKPGREEPPLMDRLALHASRIRFQNLEGEEVEVDSPIPQDIQRLLKVLEKYDS